MTSSTYTIRQIYEAHCKTVWPVFEYRLCEVKERLNALSVFCLERVLIAQKAGKLKLKQDVPMPADFLDPAIIYLGPGNEAGSISVRYSSNRPKWLTRWETCYDEAARGSEQPTAAQGPETKPRGAIFRLDKWSERQKSSSRRTAKVLDTLGPITPRPEHLLWLLVYPEILLTMAGLKQARGLGKREDRPVLDRILVTLNSFKSTSERMLLSLKITHEAIAKFQEPYETYEKNRAQRKPSPVSTGGPAPPMRGNNRNTQGNAGVLLPKRTPCQRGQVKVAVASS